MRIINLINHSVFPDDIPAISDVWILGDRFLDEIKNTFLEIVHAASKNKRLPMPYIQEYYNVKFLCDPLNAANNSTGRILNALLSGINEKNAHLPKYLLVVMDKDIIADIDATDSAAVQILQHLVYWLTHQVNIILRRKRINILEKKPGAVAHDVIHIIFVRMIRRIGQYSTESHLGAILSLRAKFNDALNDAAAKINQRILTINSCNAYEDFNSKGSLSDRDRTAFWQELDDLTYRFDTDRVKLLPNLKNPPWAQNQQHRSNRFGPSTINQPYYNAHPYPDYKTSDCCTPAYHF